MEGVERITNYCMKNGFIYPSSEIYGGLAGFYDYGHLGSKLKRNFESVWRKHFLSLHDNYVEIEASDIMHKEVFEASGHLKNFTDPVAISEKGSVERADHLVETKTGKNSEGLSENELFEKIKKEGIKSTVDGTSIKKVETMNLMFPLQAGKGVQAYLRPETAQSPYVNFKRQFELQRKKLPLGLATLGKAYRNEISPRNFTVRLRGFSQAELQIFFDPDKIGEQEGFEKVKDYDLKVQRLTARDKEPEYVKCASLAEHIPEMYVYHLAKVQEFYFEKLKIDKDKFRLKELDDSEKAFYNKYHFDVEFYLEGIGWTEIGGVHYRTDHDLKGHQNVSGEKMEVTDDNGKKFIPHVLEISLGIDRNIYALIDSNLSEKEGNTLLKIPSNLAPHQVAVFPLVKNKERVYNKAREIYEELRGKYNAVFDASGSIGRRYARQDEVGTPYCITIDFDGLEDDTVTLRYRDTSEQERVKIKDIEKKLSSS